MTSQELYKNWCSRMDTTTKSMVKCQEQGAVSKDYLKGFCEAVATSMDTLGNIIAEQS